MRVRSWSIALVVLTGAAIFSFAFKAEAGQRRGTYVTVPASFAVDPALATILANNKFYTANRFRRWMGPHHYAVYFTPYRYKSKRSRVRRATRKRRWSRRRR